MFASKGDLLMSIRKHVPLCLILCFAAAAALAAAVKTMNVQNRKADLRDSPSPFGRIVASLAYGDKVTVEQQNGPWMKISKDAASGWIHSSALTTKKIIMKSGEDTQIAASSDEVALAGKGFNADVEAQFKANHKDIDFKWVDKAEKIVIPSRVIKAFAEEGGLTASKGGAQ
jgi:uncharacterized protein YgiM (DUF1202 family)